MLYLLALLMMLLGLDGTPPPPVFTAGFDGTPPPPPPCSIDACGL